MRGWWAGRSSAIASPIAPSPSSTPPPAHSTPPSPGAPRPWPPGQSTAQCAQRGAPARSRRCRWRRRWSAACLSRPATCRSAPGLCVGTQGAPGQADGRQWSAGMLRITPRDKPRLEQIPTAYPPVKALILSSTSHTSGTTSPPPCWSQITAPRGARSATCSTARPSVAFRCWPSNMAATLPGTSAAVARSSSSCRAGRRAGFDGWKGGVCSIEGLLWECQGKLDACSSAAATAGRPTWAAPNTHLERLGRGVLAGKVQVDAVGFLGHRLGAGIVLEEVLQVPAQQRKNAMPLGRPAAAGGGSGGGGGVGQPSNPHWLAFNRSIDADADAVDWAATMSTGCPVAQLELQARPSPLTSA